MSIEIIDGFKLNRSVPIDARIVASGSTARNNIDYKYNGLRVFDTFDNIPYVWINNTWVKENINALIAANLKDNYLVKFNNITKGLTNSSIYDDGKTVFVNYTNIPQNIDTGVKLNVNGDIKASSFSGIGTNLTNLNASQIQSGLMDIKYIKPGSNGDVLTTYLDSGTPKTKWDNIKNIQSFGVSINEIPQSTSEYLILFGNIGNTNLYSSGSDNNNTHSISYSTGQLLLKTPTGKPTYSFKGNQNSGILLEDPNISFKVSNTKILEIDTVGLKITSGTLASPSLSFISDSTSGLYYKNLEYIGFVNQNSDIFRVYKDRVSVKSFTATSLKASISFNDDDRTGILFNNFLNNKNILFNININNSSKEVLKIDSVDFIIKSDTITLGKSSPTTPTSLYFYNTNGTNESSIIYKMDGTTPLLEIKNNNGGINFITAGKPITFSSGPIGKLSFSNVIQIPNTNSYSSVTLSYNTNNLEFRSNGTILTSNPSITFKTGTTHADLTCNILTCNGFLFTDGLKIAGTQTINGIYLDLISWYNVGTALSSTHYKKDTAAPVISGKSIKFTLKPLTATKTNNSLSKVLITSHIIKNQSLTPTVERLYSKIETNGDINIEIIFSTIPTLAALDNINIHAQIFIYS